MTGVSLMDIWGVSTADRGDNKVERFRRRCLFVKCYVRKGGRMAEAKQTRESDGM